MFKFNEEDYKQYKDLYYIGKDGKAYTNDGKEVSLLTSATGYKNFLSTPVHILVLTLFENKDPNPERKYVNHIDGNPNNNALDNLEWVTSRENNIHSELIRPANRRPKFYSSINGEPAELFTTLKDAAEKLECTEKQVWQAIKDNKELKGRAFTYLTIACHIPKNLIKSRPSKFYKPGKAIKMRNIVTGEELFFDSFHKAAQYFDTSKHHIWYAIRREEFRELRFFKKQWQVAYQDNDYDPLMPKDIEKSLTKGPREVFAYSYDLKKYVMFENAKIFYKENGLTKGEAMNNLAKNRIVRRKNWIFLYKNETNIQRIKEHARQNP